MMHQRRVWGVSDVATVEALADKLIEYDWTLCTGFRLAGVLFLNDATCEDGAQEYAIVRERDMAQIESVTFSWASLDSARRVIAAAVADRLSPDGFGFVDRSRVESVEEHGRCRLCA